MTKRTFLKKTGREYELVEFIEWIDRKLSWVKGNDLPDIKALLEIRRRIRQYIPECGICGKAGVVAVRGHFEVCSHCNHGIELHGSVNHWIALIEQEHGSTAAYAEHVAKTHV